MAKAEESGSTHCHNCFRFSHYVVEITIGRTVAGYLCSRCADSLKDDLNEIRGDR